MTRLSTLVLSTVFAVSMVGLTAGSAAADPPPWSAAYHKNHRHEGRHCDHPSHRRDVRYDRRPDDYRYPARAYDDGRCNAIIAKAQKARAGLARWEGTGRHQDAQRAWREVLAKTPQRLRECRIAGRRAYEAGRYAGYDRYDYDDDYYDDDYYDPYYGTNANASFELKRDWPLLIGPLLGQWGNQ